MSVLCTVVVYHYQVHVIQLRMTMYIPDQWSTDAISTDIADFVGVLHKEVLVYLLIRLEYSILKSTSCEYTVPVNSITFTSFLH